MQPTKLFLLATIALAACGSDSTAPGQPNLVGAWTLKTVAGATLPAIVQTSPTKVEVLSDTYSLTADHSYTEVATIRETSGNTVTTSASGTVGVWQQSNAGIAFTPTSPGNAYSASVNSSGMTVTLGGLAFVYQKQ